MKPLAISQMAAAAADPKHPQHHFAWGQLVGVALFGLAAYEGGPAVYASPQFLGQFIAGVSSLFAAPAPAAQLAPNPAGAVLFRGAEAPPTGTELG